MIQNYLKIAFRNLWKNRLFSLINILGLSLGLAIAIFILLYVRTELSYDDFFEGGDQIYRVLRRAELNGVPYLIGVTSAPYATALQTDFPQTIKAAVRVMQGPSLVSYENRSFSEDNFYAVDANFFEFFSFPLAQGNPATVLENPNSIVLTQQMARKYFGGADPVGKTLRIDDQTDLMVTGVMAEPPGRSHLDIDFVSSLDLFKEQDWYRNWWSNGLFTYLRIESPAEASSLQALLPGFIDKYLGKDFERSGNRIDLRLQPLSDVYFMNEVRYDDALHGDATAVKIFFAVAIFILLVAVINYMNLTTARAGRRVREIGVRKVLGASPGKLILQFLAESFLLTFGGILLAIAAVEILLPSFNALFDLELSIAFTQPFIIFLFSGLLAGVALLAGSYPAFMLSSFHPVRVLKGGTERLGRDALLRKGLVVFQFTVSVVLVVVTVQVGQQLDFLRSKDLGFNDEQVVLVRLNNEPIRERREAFKARLQTEPGIESVTLISGEPGGYHDTMSHEVEGHPRNLRFRTVFADEDYVSTFGMKIVAGRDLSTAFGTDVHKAVLINETAARQLGWSNEEAIGKRIKNIFADTTYREIVGVVQDFHFASLKKNIEPLVISPVAWVRTAAIKIDAAEIPQTLREIEKQWQEIAPAYPFEFTFLDNAFFELYRQEQREETLFKVFTFVSIFIACLGIFALAAFAAEERTKEVGIRKVLGASMTAVVRLLSGEFLILVALASFIAWPVAWYAINTWLQNFAYRIDISWWVFVLAGGLALLIALLTVSTQAVKAALANPVDSLRYE